MLLAAAVAVMLAPAARAEARADSLARYGVGLLRLADGRPKSATVQLEASAKLAPGAAAPKAALVPLYRRLGRPNAAVRAARGVLALDPADAATAVELAELELEAKRPAAAVRVLLPFAAPPSLAGRLPLLTLLSRAAELAKDGGAMRESAEAALGVPGLEPASRARWLERLGRAHELQARPREALAAYGEAALLTPGTEGRARLAWHRSGVFLLEGNAADALAEVEKVLALKPSGIEPYERFAEVMGRLGRQNQLAPALERMAGENPRNEALRWLAAAALGAADRRAGLARFRELLDGATEESPCRRYVEFCRDAGATDHLLDALDAYSAAARAGKGGPRGAAERLAVGRLRGLAGAVKSTPGVAAPLLDALQAKPGRLATLGEDTRGLVVVLAERAGRYGVLIQAARQAFDSGGDGATERLMAALYAGRDWRGVLDLCDELDRGRPSRVNTDYHRANALYERGDEAGALAALELAAPKVLDATLIQLRKATMLTGAGRPAEGAAVARRVLAEAQPPKIAVEAELHLAAALGELGQTADSDEAFERALALAPDSALVLNNYGYHLAETGRRLDDAEAMLRRAVEISQDDLARAGAPDPVNGSFGDSLGWVLFQRGKFAEAQAQLERAAGTIGSAPDDAGAGATDGVVFDHLGDVYLRLNESKLAVGAYRRAQKLYEGTHQGREKGRAAEVRRKLAFAAGDG